MLSFLGVELSRLRVAANNYSQHGNVNSDFRLVSANMYGRPVQCYGDEKGRGLSNENINRFRFLSHTLFFKIIQI